MAPIIMTIGAINDTPSTMSPSMMNPSYNFAIQTFFSDQLILIEAFVFRFIRFAIWAQDPVCGSDTHWRSEHMLESCLKVAWKQEENRFFLKFENWKLWNFVVAFPLSLFQKLKAQSIAKLPQPAQSRNSRIRIINLNTIHWILSSRWIPMDILKFEIEQKTNPDKSQAVWQCVCVSFDTLLHRYTLLERYTDTGVCEVSESLFMPLKFEPL